MNKSESIKEIAVALAKFNGEVSKISKDAKNLQFKSEYVTLDALIQATRPILQSHGLSIMQFPLAKETGEIGVQTMLLHESGEFIESEPLYMTPVRMVKGGIFEIAKDPQAAGSVISYLRRYSYQAILNLNTGEDDDANKATPPQYVVDENTSPEEAGCIICTFGKYQGKTLKEIYKEDIKYFEWLVDKATDTNIKIACKVMMDALKQHKGN